MFWNVSIHVWSGWKAVWKPIRPKCSETSKPQEPAGWVEPKSIEKLLLLYLWHWETTATTLMWLGSAAVNLYTACCPSVCNLKPLNIQFIEDQMTHFLLPACHTLLLKTFCTAWWLYKKKDVNVCGFCFHSNDAERHKGMTVCMRVTKHKKATKRKRKTDENVIKTDFRLAQSKSSTKTSWKSVARLEIAVTMFCLYHSVKINTCNEIFFGNKVLLFIK